MAKRHKKSRYTQKEKKRGKKSDNNNSQSIMMVSGTTSDFSIYKAPEPPRELLIEKYTAPSYITEEGEKYWVDRYGETIRGEYPDGTPTVIINNAGHGFRGEEFIQAGYVYAPYTPLIITPIINDITVVAGTGTTTVDEIIL